MHYNLQLTVNDSDPESISNLIRFVVTNAYLPDSFTLAYSQLMTCAKTIMKLTLVFQQEKGRKEVGFPESSL